MEGFAISIKCSGEAGSFELNVLQSDLDLPVRELLARECGSYQAQEPHESARDC